MNRGQGTLGLLLNDPSLYQRTDSVLIELRALSADIRANPKRYVSVRPVLRLPSVRGKTLTTFSGVTDG